MRSAIWPTCIGRSATAAPPSAATKRNEEILRLPLGELKDCPFTIRGEMALVVEGASPAESWESLSVEAHVALYVGQGMPEMDAIKAVAADRGLPKSEVYARVKIKKEE